MKLIEANKKLVEVFLDQPLLLAQQSVDLKCLRTNPNRDSVIISFVVNAVIGVIRASLVTVRCIIAIEMTGTGDASGVRGLVIIIVIVSLIDGFRTRGRGRR
jgi:hypothetical protein